MTRPIEAVLAEAQERLNATGRLDVTAFVSAYPEHAHELRELLPVMLRLHQEKRWQAAEAQSRAFALSLFPALTAPAPAAGEETLGSLLHRARTEAGLTLEEQARQLGIPVQALERLSEDPTPLSALDNATIKQLATKVAAPFANLVKEIRRLASLEQLSRMQAGPVFTRDKETSTTAEQEALREQVRRSARKPPAPPTEK
jgi:transcriptional regulator with XRE-family HTH domain